MKIETDLYGQMRLDVKTESRGNTAVNQFVNDPNTEVYYGGLHACVTFVDLNLEVTMNPEPGNWNDAKWARDKAWQCVCMHLTPEVLQQVFTAIRACGHSEGIGAARLKMREALGL